MKKTKIIVFALTVLFGLMQFFQPDIDTGNPKTKLLGNIPDSVESVFRNSCFDCHSNQTDLRWFDKITPVNFLVASHIRDGRSALDFTTYDSLNSDKKNAVLFYALNKALSGEMPLPPYTLLHKNSELKDDDFKLLKNYLLGVSHRKPSDGKQSVAINEKRNAIQNAGAALHVKSSTNGIDYIPDYRTWKAISTSDRFDNGTMRIIYANDIAVRAIQNRQTQHWPDGAIIAKAAWGQHTNYDSTISMGPFRQVEFMIKDSKKYESTKGWGWARWVKDDLKPYGQNDNFVHECISCHSPMKENDFVFTAPLNLE